MIVFLILKKETVDQSFIKYFFYDDKMEIGKKTFTVLPIKSVSYVTRIKGALKSLTVPYSCKQNKTINQVSFWGLSEVKRKYEPFTVYHCKIDVKKKEDFRPLSLIVSGLLRKKDTKILWLTAIPFSISTEDSYNEPFCVYAVEIHIMKCCATFVLCCRRWKKRLTQELPCDRLPKPK